MSGSVRECNHIKTRRKRHYCILSPDQLLKFEENVPKRCDPFIYLISYNVFKKCRLATLNLPEKFSKIDLHGNGDFLSNVLSKLLDICVSQLTSETR